MNDEGFKTLPMTDLLAITRYEEPNGSAGLTIDRVLAIRIPNGPGEAEEFVYLAYLATSCGWVESSEICAMASSADIERLALHEVKFRLRTKAGLGDCSGLEPWVDPTKLDEICEAWEREHPKG